ncbi:MAG: hypothetical protein AAGI23_15835 [Bacteroidota bacterium]
MKTVHQIEQLLEKYFEGKTSIAEEKALKSYFQRSTIAPHLEVYRDLFNYFDTSKQVGYTPKSENTAKIVNITNTRRRNYKWWWQVAAVLAIGISVWLLIPQTYQSNSIADSQVEWSDYEEENPELAYEETLKALELLSEALGGSEKKVVQEMDNFAALKHALE